MLYLYKETEKLSQTAFSDETLNENDQNENWVQSFHIHFLNNNETNQIPFIQHIALAISNLKDIYNIQSINQLINECPPQFFEILLDFLKFVFDNPVFDIQNLLDFEFIFQPLITKARLSFFDIPQNIYLLICFFGKFISNRLFYNFFLKSPCIETPFDVISLIFSDAAHNINEEERDQFDTSLISNCLLLIGAFFNYDLIIKLPQLENSITQLLYNIKCPQINISYFAVCGAIKALKICPKITVDLFFEENIFSDIISILLNDENANNNPSTNEIKGGPPDQIHPEIVQIDLLNLIHLVIKYDDKNHFFQIVNFIPDLLHKQMLRCDHFQIKALQILLDLSQLSDSNEQNMLIQLQATNDSIKLLITDSSFIIKRLSFQYLISLIKFPNYQFFKEHMFIFEFINQFIYSLSFDDLLDFIRSMKRLLNLFNQKKDMSLNNYLVQIGFVEELSSLTNGDDTYDTNLIDEIVNIINSSSRT